MGAQASGEKLTKSQRTLCISTTIASSCGDNVTSWSLEVFAILLAAAAA